MSGRALHFTALGPLEPNSRASLGVEIRATGMPSRPVVLIPLPADIAKDPVRLAEIQARTESAVRINHPQVIQVIGLEQLDDGWTRIVEYGHGESLARLLIEAQRRQERPAPSVASAILADACLGVHQAHEIGEARDPTRPQLHGGLRPGTLLVTHTGRTKVTGYGAAVFAPSGKAALHAYLAPEQVVGGVEAMTRQTDVYALGAVLYELLAGAPPFAPEEGLLDNLILTTRPQAMRVSDEPELAEIALKALSKRASDRYPTALAMREALLACRVAAPASSEVVTRWLDGLLPPTHPERIARRSMLDSAASTTGKITLPHDAVGSISGPGSVPRPLAVPPPPPPPDVPAAAVPPPPAVPVPEARPKATTKSKPQAFTESSILPYEPTHSERVEIKAQSNRRVGMIGGVVAGMVIGSAAFAYWKTHSEGEEEQAPRMLVSAPVDAGTSKVMATLLPDGGWADGGLATPDAGATVAPVVVDAGPRLYVLEVSTDPPMEIKVDGKVIGKEEAMVSLPEGPHHIEAADRALRAFASRDVDLRTNHQKVELVVGSAQLAFDVPAGATVTLDGKEIGKAPVEPVDLYSGPHEVVVDFNGAETTQHVQMHADQNLTLTVHAN